MSTANTHYDVIIIGSGQAGTPLAAAFQSAGQKTAIIERSHVGGCCVNEGCTPTKTMISSGRVAYLAKRAAEYGVHFAGEGTLPPAERVKVDMEKVRERKRDIVMQWRTGSVNRLAKAGVEVVEGDAKFVDAKTVAVKMNGTGEERMLTADKIFVNVGERPSRPQIEGIDTVDQSRILDSTSVMELGEVPGHLIVLGGGYIGLEFGQLFRRLGAEVTIIQRAKQLLPREDEDISQTMLEILQEDGITVHLSTNASKLSASSDSANSITVATTTTTSSNSAPTISGTHILFASGRIPNTDTLNLPAAGITTNSHGYITTNTYLETSAPNIWALGDVKGPPAFTHISYDDFRIIRDNLLDATNNTRNGIQKASIANRPLLTPYVVYTDPQLGRVGLSHRQALEKYPDKKIQVAKMPMSYVARALETAEARGMIKAVVDGESGEILGFTCLGLEGGEVMAVVQMAMVGGVKWWQLQEMVFAHPSLAEGLNNLWGFLE